MIDGAGPFIVFSKIILPVCKPVLAAIAIFTAVDQWNAWMDNFYLADIPNLQTLQLLLLTYMTDQASQMTSAASRMRQTVIEVTPVSIRMTITMIVTLPILFVYPVFSKTFYKRNSYWGCKGISGRKLAVDGGGLKGCYRIRQCKYFMLYSG